MLINILKELISFLSILVISKEEEVHAYIGEEYLRYCKKLKIVETLDEAQNMCNNDVIDLMVINTDRFGRDSLRFIEQNIKHHPQQSIIVSARQFNDASVLIQLTNLGVAGFISKNLAIEEIFPMLLRVCNKIHEHSMLKHYVKDLEEQIAEALHIPCRKDCPRESTLTRHKLPLNILNTKEDLDFFPTTLPDYLPSNAKVDQSIYQDYFSFLTGEDRDELHDILCEIDVLLLNASTKTFVQNSYQLELLGEMFRRFGNTLMHYQFFSDTGLAIIELGQTIVTYRENMGNKGSDFDAVLSGFCSVLLNYMHEVWEKEADDPKFFNDSIINDAHMICSLVVPSSSNQTDDDLIFF